MDIDFGQGGVGVRLVNMEWGWMELRANYEYQVAIFAKGLYGSLALEFI